MAHDAIFNLVKNTYILDEICQVW